MEYLKKLFTLICLCVSYSVNAQYTSPVINLAEAWKSQPEVLNISAMTDNISYNVIKQKDIYRSAGKIENKKDYVLFKQTLYYDKELSMQHTYNSGEFIDNGIIKDNDSICYYQLSGGSLQIFDIKGNRIKSLNIPLWVNRICPLSSNEIVAYRTRSTEITNKGLAELCIIDINTGKTVFTHFSLSEKDAKENRLWFPLMNNNAWTYCGKMYFYENVSNNIYEIVKNTDDNFSFMERFKINISPLSTDYPQTKNISPKDYKMGTSLHITSVKEMSKCIIFNVTLNNIQTKLVFMKDKNKTVNAFRINPDIDGIANGEDIIPFSQLNKQQQETLMSKRGYNKEDANSLFILPVYQ